MDRTGAGHRCKHEIIRSRWNDESYCDSSRFAITTLASQTDNVYVSIIHCFCYSTRLIHGDHDHQHHHHHHCLFQAARPIKPYMNVLRVTLFSWLLVGMFIFCDDVTGCFYPFVNKIEN